MRIFELTESLVQEAGNDMLDISILNVDKAVSNTKKQVQPEKIRALLNMNMTVTQKFDGCFVYETLVETKTGMKPIGQLVDEKSTEEVKSFDHEKQEIVWAPITGHSVMDEVDEWFEVETENGQKFIVTENHWVWSVSKDDYVQVRDLEPGEELLVIDNED